MTKPNLRVRKHKTLNEEKSKGFKMSMVDENEKIQSERVGNSNILVQIQC